MVFEWDDEKSERNLQDPSRGFGFDQAALIFEGLTLEKADTRRDYGEIQVQAIGAVNGDVLFVVHTDREDGVRRIISARLASKKERDLWRSFASP